MSNIEYVCEQCLDGREGDKWSGFDRDEVEEYDSSENCDVCSGDNAEYRRE